MSTLAIKGQEYNIEDLAKNYNIPTENIAVVGANLVSTNADEFVKREKVFETWRCFPIDGFAGSTHQKIYEGIFENSEYDATQLFDESIVNVESLREAGLGPSQAPKFIEGLKAYRNSSITADKLIRMLAIDGCGSGTREQYARYLYGQKYSFERKTKSVIDALVKSEPVLIEIGQQLKQYGGIEVVPLPEEKVVEITEDTVTYVMTGRPAACGFEGTKAVFQEKLPDNWIEAKKLTTETTYLVAGDANSNSSKAKTARKNGTKVITYIQALELI